MNLTTSKNLSARKYIMKKHGINNKIINIPPPIIAHCCDPASNEVLTIQKS